MTLTNSPARDGQVDAAQGGDRDAVGLVGPLEAGGD